MSNEKVTPAEAAFEAFASSFGDQRFDCVAGATIQRGHWLKLPQSVKDAWRKAAEAARAA